MPVEEFLVILRDVQQPPLRDVEVAQQPQVTGVSIADLLQQLAPVFQQQLDFGADSGELVLVRDIGFDVGHHLFDETVQLGEIALLFLDSHLGEADIRQRRLAIAHLAAILRQLGQVLSLLDEQASDNLTDTAHLESLAGTRQTLFDRSGLALGGRELAGYPFDISGDLGEFACQLGIALGQLADDRVLALGGEFGQRSVPLRPRRGRLALLVDHTLQDFGHLLFIGQFARSDITPRLEQREAGVVAQKFLVETGEFGGLRVTPELQGQLAGIREYRAFAGGRSRGDGRVQLVPVGAQLVDALPRLRRAILLLFDLVFEFGEPRLPACDLGKFARQCLVDLRQWHVGVDAQGLRCRRRPGSPVEPLPKLLCLARRRLQHLGKRCRRRFGR